MEATVGGEAHPMYGLAMPDLRKAGKRSLEWNLNDWKWDGDLFIATQLKSAPTDCHSRQLFPLGAGVPEAGNSSNSSSTCSDEVDLEKEKRELEKRRRVIVVDDDNLNEEAGTLSLKLGGHGYTSTEREVGNWEGTSGKKTKLVGVAANRAVCQVEDCGADLSKGKDYHRRHKVCEMHSKASKALVGKIMQRFCQQCSRFHALQEFDEGKRSCRRRLAGHNKRRRKTHPDAVVSGSSMNDEQASGYLLISLLRILSNMQSNKSEQMKDQDLLCHLLKSLAAQADAHGGRNMSMLLQESNDLPSDRTSVGNCGTASALLANGPQGMPKATEGHYAIPESEMQQRRGHADVRGGDIQIMSSSKAGIQFPIKDSVPACTEVRDSTVERIKLNNFDLNDTYVDSDDCVEEIERFPASANIGAGSLEYPSWIQQDSNQSSPIQTSRQSDSASAQSPSSSSGDAQSRTDRIVFKLFGKEPSDIPVVMRAQILDWLSHSPTDIESYIRPGCIILTVYLRLAESSWEQLCCDLTSELSRLLEVSDNTFWRTGWVYIRIQHQIAFIYNGQVVVDTPLRLKNNNYPKILSVKPIAISVTEKAQFVVKGFNLSRPATRLLCALEGKYLVQGTTSELLEGDDIVKEDDELQCLNISCSIPMVIGRGFIEIEDHGLGSSFFPFIVAEEDVCSEIRMLETTLNFDEAHVDINGGTGKVEPRNEALNFIHEMGWLLHRSHLKSRLGHSDPNSNAFPFKRLRWLMEFSMEHDWCSVVKKLLDIFLEGIVDSGDHNSLMLALLEMNLLHRAVRRNSRPLVELLLRYVPIKVADGLESEFKSLKVGERDSLLFRPDVVGAAGLTPLHIVAGRDGSEDVLDALTDDPSLVGIAAWKNARDTTGCTPEDYARLRGHYSYIHLVQRKANKHAPPGQVVLDIPAVPLEDSNINQKQTERLTTGFEIARADMRANNKQCKLCDQKLAYRNTGRSLVYRPAMLSMVAIAAVCVCVALLFKSFPLVNDLHPFRWEWLDYGPR